MFESIFSLPLGLIIIFGLRLLVPLTIFRWPFWGGLASLLIDGVDVDIARTFGTDIPAYIFTDKYLDLYYLTIELIVSFSWVNKLARTTSIALYFWRLIGVIVFQSTRNEIWLVVTPNLFEYFFLTMSLLQLLGHETTRKFWLNSKDKAAQVLFLLLILKMPQEFFLHARKIHLTSPVEIFLNWLQNSL